MAYLHCSHEDFYSAKSKKNCLQIFKHLQYRESITPVYKNKQWENAEETSYLICNKSQSGFEQDEVHYILLEESYFSDREKGMQFSETIYIITNRNSRG